MLMNRASNKVVLKINITSNRILNSMCFSREMWNDDNKLTLHLIISLPRCIFEVLFKCRKLLYIRANKRSTKTTFEKLKSVCYGPRAKFWV